MAENIRISETEASLSPPATLGRMPLEPIANVPFAALYITSKYGPWVNRVRPYGEWDYKRLLDDHEEFQDFGNFNFGVTGAALGISEEELLRRAGQLQGLMDRVYRRPGPANPTEYGDHPRDDAMIRLGYAFYTAMQRGQ